MAHRTPTVRIGIFGFFDTRGRFWTPEWDFDHHQSKDVKEVRMPDGTWHQFDGFVCMAEATKFLISNMKF